MLNLLTNALAAITRRRACVGGPTGRVVLSVRGEGHDAVLDITDNGCGLPAEMVGHLFDPFPAGRSDEGAGLGLSISYGIVDDMGGRIDAANNRGAGEGASFHVRLPLACGARAEAAHG